MAETKKILVVRFSSIGDIVLTSPVIRCIHKRYPNAIIHFLTKEQYKPLIENHPAIKYVYTIQKSIKEVWDKLADEKYNHIIDLHKNRHSRPLRYLRHSYYSTYPKRNIKKWILVNAKYNLLSDEHIVDRYFYAVRHLNTSYDEKGLDFYLPSQVDLTPSSLPAAFQNGFGVIVLGAQHFTKQIPVSLIIDILKLIKQPVVLIGDKHDYKKGEEVSLHLPKQFIFNAAGSFDLLSSASIIKHGDWVLTGDTGMMHIAAALHKKIISVWGSTVPQFGMWPLFPKGVNTKSVIIENTEIYCRPCSKLGYNQCPKEHFLCMKSLSAKQIADAIKV